METTGNKLLTNANNAELCSFERVLEITMVAFKNIHSALMVIMQGHKHLQHWCVSTFCSCFVAPRSHYCY